MRKNFIFIAISLVLTLSMCFFANNFMSQSNMDNVVHAKCITYTVEDKETSSYPSENTTPNDMGSIPFALYTTTWDGDKYTVVDYVPSFKEPVVSGNSVTYEIADDSIPYIFMSSKNSPIKESFYNTTLYFKFNKSSSDPLNRIESFLTTISLRNSKQAEPFSILPSYDNSEPNNVTLDFAVNLSTDDVNKPTECAPYVIDNDGNHVKLGEGMGDEEVSFREGLYTFEISYIPISQSGLVGKYHCTFILSFYVLDFDSYSPADNAPLEMYNADKYEDTNPTPDSTEDFYLFNYNYDSLPYIEYDASKFALNFEYSVPTSATSEKLYYFNYQKFEPTAHNIVNGVAKVGDVYVYSPYFNDSFSIPVYDYNPNDNVTEYIAIFDIEDFEEKYILNHSLGLGTACAQGVYHFSLEMLTTSLSSNKLFEKVNEDTMPSSIKQILQSQNLVVYGYDLRYNDAETGNDRSLKNDKYSYNLISYNTASKNSKTMFINIPDKLITTNLTPLNFHSYGNLTNGYKAKFILDTKSSDANFLSTYFSDIKGITEAELELAEKNAELESKTAEKEALEEELGQTDPDDTDRIAELTQQIEELETEITGISDVISGLEAQVEYSEKQKAVNAISGMITATSKNEYTQSSTISGNGIWLMELEYTVSLVINGTNVSIMGVQYVAFRIDNTTQSLYAHAVEFDAGNNLQGLYTFNQYTNRNIRIATKYADNAIMAPIKIKYSLYQDFYYKSGKPDSYGELSLKVNDGSYILTDASGNQVEYQYYVLSQSSKYTFSADGAYVITISNSRGSAISSIIINKESNGINNSVRKVYTVDLETKGKTNIEISKNANGIYMTSSPFTLEWTKPKSDSTYYTYIGYMGLGGDYELTSKNLFQFGSDYYLTNEYAFSDYIGNIEPNYANSYEQSNDLANYQYFKKDGIYFFYVYDKAGNYFTETILLDSTLPATMQGSYINNVWANDNITGNNYVNRDTTLFFGSYKSLRLPIANGTMLIEANDNSYVKKYNASLEEVVGKESVRLFGNDNIGNDFYAYIRSLADVKQFTKAKIGLDASTNYYYLNIANTNLNYEKTKNGEVVATGNLNGSDLGSIVLYRFANALQTFSGEAQYHFVLTAGNGREIDYYVEMNFDMIGGTFYAYNDNISNKHSIQKDAATNMNYLAFEYNSSLNVSEDISDCYSLSSLTYDYYEFDYEFGKSKGGYPLFKKDASRTNVNMLTSAVSAEDGTKRIIERINVATVDSITGTMPGKYVITRVYRGGTHNKVDEAGVDTIEINGEYYKPTESGYGGRYVILNGDGANSIAVDLFELDTLERTYTVYVDRNGIISRTYIPSTTNRQVGNEIKLKFGDNEVYEFVDFFKTSINGNNLVTNKIPVQIDIPYSKYFGKDDTSYYASTFKFAKLNITITFYPENGGASRTYVIDGKNYDMATGMCRTNNGEPLIFNECGRYVIEISDSTGYIDTKTGKKNVDATYFTYTFFVRFTTPSAELYYTVSNGTDVNESNLIELNGDTFATNINTSINQNSIHVYLTDNENPYTFNVKTVTISNQNNQTLVDISILTEDTTEYTSGLIKKIVRNKLSSEVYDNVEYKRYSYQLYLDAVNEGEYTILLSYGLDEANPSYNYSTIQYSLKIDKTKPNNNICRLIEDDLFLSTYDLYKGDTKQESQTKIKNNFLEENFNTSITNTPSVFNYAFPINNSFALNYNADDTVDYFYVRNYEKFTSLNTSDSNSSITPDMTIAVYPEGKAYYDNEIEFGGYTKFSEVGLYNGVIELGTSTYYKISYRSGVSLYNQILSATGISDVNGYYEIIEKDIAGNYRCYTVYFAPSGLNAYKMLEFSGIDEDSLIRGTNEEDVSGKSFTLQSMRVATGWGKVTITTNEKNIEQKIILFTPDKNYISDDDLSQLHSSTGALNSINTLDRKIILTLSDYNSMVKGISRQINLSKGDTELTFNAYLDNDGKYTIELPKSKKDKDTAVYLTSFKLSVYKNSRYNTEIEYLESANPGFFENGKCTGLEEGMYLIEYKVNMRGDTTFKYFLHLGGYYINDFETEYQFQYKYEYNELNQTYYSGGRITVTYEAEIYSVKVNGVLISGTDREKTSTSLHDRGCKTFDLTSNWDLGKMADTSIGGETSFVVEYYAITDSTALQKTKRFIICDYLPEITLYDASSGQEIKSSIVDNQSQVTNSSVGLNWGDISSNFEKLNDCLTATLYRKNASTNIYEVVIEDVSRGEIIKDEGNYKLQLSNSMLGNYRNAYFSIQMGEVSLFSVTVDNELIYPSNIEKLSLYASNLIDNIYYKLSTRHSNGQMQEIVERNEDEFAILTTDMGYVNGIFSSDKIGISNVLNVDHYYTTRTDYEVNYNSMLNLKEQKFIYANGVLTDLESIPNQVGNTYYTTIYLVYTLKGPIRIKLFAVTVVPTVNNLLTEGALYASNGSRNIETIQLNTSMSKVLSNNNGIVKNGKTNLSWETFYGLTANRAWYNQGNYVYVLDQYGEDGNYYPLKFVKNDNGRSTSVISGSGTHKLMFRDFAGNTHQFSSNTFVTEQYVYTLSLIDQVIYYVEYKNIIYNPAVQYAVYNDSVKIVIDKSYLSKDFYTLSKVSISVTKNGVHYNGYTMQDNILTFTETGKYVLSFDAKYESRSLNTATYNFTILSKDAARLAYEFVEVTGYEITSIIKDGENITSRYMRDGKVTSLFISSSSNESGNGRYEVTMKYGEKENEKLSFSFYINDYIPIIYCNVEHGATTTGDIVITYDRTTLYEQLGKCYINIKIYNNDSKTFLNYGTIEISKDRNNHGVDSRTISLSNSYFIQIQTENGNIISSYRVDKTDPLNAFAIIAIILAVIGVVALVIIIIKLRTRMKIR